MKRKFNDTGVCVPQRHYMVDISAKIAQIMRMVEAGEYFTIHRPRQYGKTTTLWMLSRHLNAQDDYLALNISFEGIGGAPFVNEHAFCPAFLRIIARSVQFTRPELHGDFAQAAQYVHTFEDLSQFISRYVLESQKNIVLLIDEVDKSSNNQLFLDFLGMLRQKYLQRAMGQGATFHSVILAGVHDVKTLKAKIRPDEEQKYNSPWNIAVDFKVDMSFAPHEIETMLQDYRQDRDLHVEMPDAVVHAIAERLYYYTSGYPYLVSKLCKFMDEDIASQRTDKAWAVADVDAAFKMIVDKRYTTTLFDSLIKNLENHRELYDLIFRIVINGEKFDFTIANPVMNLAYLYGIMVPSEQGHCQIHNRVFEQRIYDYMLSKFIQKTAHQVNGVEIPNFYSDAGLDIPLILQRFQAFMQEHYSNRDAQFLEREGRLLFLSYLRPIINGRGFDFKEPNVGDERRMDIVITYQNQRYVIELKIWRGPKKHAEGLQQLSDYLDNYGLTEGYLLIYDFRKDKVYQEEQIAFRDKQIFAVWV
jgi:hypothetical protein